MSLNAKQSLMGSVDTGTVKVYSYYTPNVTQPDENTMQVEYVPSSKNMPAMDPVALTLPKGKDGLDGKDGYTPQKGVDYFDGKDGSDGKDGIDGKDGYTPQKGIDYFTNDDVSQVAGVATSVVLNELFNATLVELELEYDTDKKLSSYGNTEPINPVLEAGKEYLVITDSGENRCVCKQFAMNGVALAYVGNPYLITNAADDTGESFVYGEAAPTQFEGECCAVDLSGGTTMRVVSSNDTINPKFLPEMATEEYITRATLFSQTLVELELMRDEDDGVSVSMPQVAIAPTLEAGKEYLVITDSGETRCVCEAIELDGRTFVYVGNKAVLTEEESDNTGESFIYVEVAIALSTVQYMAMDFNGSTTMRIGLPGEGSTINPKFLPEMDADAISEEVLNTLFNETVAEYELEYDADRSLSVGASDGVVPSVLEVGKEYTVITDSGETRCVCKQFAIVGIAAAYVGNLAASNVAGTANTGESFLYIEELTSPPRCQATAIDLSSGTMMRVVRSGDTINPKFLPEMEAEIDTESFATKEYVEELITGVIGGSY